MKLVIGSTGASGAIYLQRLLKRLAHFPCEVHLVLGGHAAVVIDQELGRLEIPPCVIAQYDDSSMLVPFTSGSALFDAMAIVPCSMGTLARIAHGTSDSSLLRAADVFLKERRPLILVPRETPFSLVHAKNLVSVIEAGAKSRTGNPFVLPSTDDRRRSRGYRSRSHLDHLEFEMKRRKDGELTAKISAIF